MSPVSSVESWFFSSLGWKVPMPTRSFSLSTSRRTRTCSHHLRPVALVTCHQIAEDEAAGGVQVAVDAHLELVGRQAQLVMRPGAPRPAG